MTDFLDVQNGLYNAMLQGLGLSGSSFQLIQPSPPLLPNDNHFLWNYFNNIPPKTLTQNYIAAGGNQFFSNYKGLNSALKSVVEDRLVKDVGQNIVEEFNNFIQLKDPPPALRQLPSLFRSWAFLRHSSVANKGASALAAMLLDPIASAQLALMPYEGDPDATPPIPPKQPDWDVGYKQLIQLLGMAPSRSFNFKRSTMNTNVTNTWSRGSHSGFFGLWRGSRSSSSQSVTFSQSEFTINASFGHVLLFAATPGSWYSSAATGLAYSHKSGVPWDPTSPINWNNTFDPNTGNLARFMVNLIVVDTMNIDVKSFAKYGHDDQVVIQNNSGGGLWPFYTGNSSSGASQRISFADDQTMTVTTTSLPGIPIVLGGNILPVNQYVGHAIAGARLFAESLEANHEFRDRLASPPELELEPV
jgi:hypothetical protein